MAATTNTGAGESIRVTYPDFLRTGPGTLAGRYLRMFWQPVCLARDLPAGRTKPIRIMSEDLTLYRGENLSPNPSPTRGREPNPPSLAEPALSLPKGKGAGGLGQPHLLAFRCAHRGTQLSTGWVEGDELRCFYHGWKYGPDGQCVEQPAEPEPFCQRIRIRSYPVREYLGMIFAYLGEGDPPAFPRLLDFEETEYSWDVSCLTWPCSFFTQLDNAVDPAHTSITHWQFDRPLSKHLVVEENECGLIVANGPGGVEKTPSFLHMPNAHEWGGPPRGGKDSWNYARGWRVPIDDGHHLRFGLEVVATKGEEAALRAAWREQAARVAEEVAEDALAGRVSTRTLTLEQYPGPALTNVQDYIILVGLGPIAEHPNDERLGRSDVGVVALRKLWARELQALADGRPLKQWHRPERLWRDVEARAAAEASKI